MDVLGVEDIAEAVGVVAVLVVVAHATRIHRLRMGSVGKLRSEGGAKINLKKNYFPCQTATNKQINNFSKMTGR